jgi:hypothetical protein
MLGLKKKAASITCLILVLISCCLIVLLSGTFLQLSKPKGEKLFASAYSPDRSYKLEIWQQDFSGTSGLRLESRLIKRECSLMCTKIMQQTAKLNCVPNGSAFNCQRSLDSLGSGDWSQIINN